MSQEPGPVLTARIDDWRRRLIDLSARNRLISYKATAASTLTIASPHVERLFEDLGSGRKVPFYLPPEVDPGESAIPPPQPHQGEIVAAEADPKRINRTLNNLARKSRAEFQDKALRILYLAAGFLHWNDADGKDLVSPLVLVPVELVRASPRDPYFLTLVEDEDIVVNPSLTEKLRRDEGLRIGDDWEWEDKPVGEELEEIEALISDKGWRVERGAALTFFSFQKNVMYRDLLDNEAKIAAHPLIGSLATGQPPAQEGELDLPTPGDLDERQKLDEVHSVLDADATQRVCIEASRRGQSFVMQGPPGTGKSQTITNIIAEAIGAGKRVLFVSEKAAALDVVHRRLIGEGLDEYCLVLHGEHAARREVVKALERSMTSSLQSPGGMRSDEMGRLRHLTEWMNVTADLLHAPAPELGDRTPRQVFELLAELHGAQVVPGAPAASSARGAAVDPELHQTADVFERLSERWRVSAPDFPWAGHELTKADAGALATAAEQARAVASSLHALTESAAAMAERVGLEVPTDLKSAVALAALARHLESMPELDAPWVDSDINELAQCAEDAKKLLTRRATAAAAAREQFPNRDLASLSQSSSTLSALNRAFDDFVSEFGEGEAWSSDLGQLAKLPGSLTRTRSILSELRQRVAAVAQDLGETMHDPTRTDVERTAALANLAFIAQHRPPAKWLVMSGIEQAERVLGIVSDDLQAYQQGAAALREKYDAAILDVEAEALLQRFTTQHGSFFSRLTSTYRADVKLLKQHARSGKAPDDPVSLLKQICGLRTNREVINKHASEMSGHLQDYDAGLETDLVAVRSALKLAREVVTLRAASADLERLAANICFGTPSNPGRAQDSERLTASLGALDAEIRSIGRFAGRIPVPFQGSLAALGAAVEAIEARLHPAIEVVADLNWGGREDLASFTTARERADVVGTYVAAEAAVQKSETDWARVLGERFTRSDAPWESLDAGLQWLRTFRALLPDCPDQLNALVRAHNTDTTIADLVAAIDVVEQAVGVLCDGFQDSAAEQLRARLMEPSLAEADQTCAQLVSSAPDLADWAEWKHWRARAIELGWGAFVNGLAEQQRDAAEVPRAFRAAFWSARLALFLEVESEFGEDIRGSAFERFRREYIELDRRLVQTGADRLIHARESTRQQHVMTPGSETALVRKEANKKRRHMPVRDLLARVPNLLSDLKPCLLMSPLTVSHFLSPDHEFDLVVFDEASQVPPWDAINCIYRGRQIVVAGDSNQLPPTQFFQVTELSADAVHDDEVYEEDTESILDACQSLLPLHRLLWHYRSHAESLIRFSNEQIYDGSLITFPSASEGDPSFGVSLTFVEDGCYERGGSRSNPVEARAVAERAVEYLRDGSGRSLGIIAFNAPHADAIERELEALRAQDSALNARFSSDRLDTVFVKSLESVQGDERDVILLSVGYGKDPEGKFSMVFGPLNADGGHRRLNVAVTRARERLEVVASVRSTDFRLSDGASRGAKLLREYLAYAESRAAGAHVVGNGKAAQSALEADVFGVVTDLGFDAVSSVGAGQLQIDIAVKDPRDPARFLLGIECDGTSWAGIPTARDRERLRHEVLRALGWRDMHRVWSSDWVRNREAERARLADALERAMSDQPTPTPDETPREGPARVERIVPELGEGDVTALSWVQHYRSAFMPDTHLSGEFHDPYNRNELSGLLLKCLATEAPVHARRAMTQVAQACGYRHVGKRIEAAMNVVIATAAGTGDLEVREDFLWRTGQVIELVRVPDPGDEESRRGVEEIPPEELDLAIKQLRLASPGVTDDELVRTIARLFGFRRTGASIREVISSRIVLA